MEKILYLESCKAQQELRAREPLTEEEYSKMKAMIGGCPLQGQAFDEVSKLYPLIIPRKAAVYELSQANEVYSVGVRLDRQGFVNVIGGRELMDAYGENLGGLLFVVGSILSKKKGDKEYYNIRPRGWLLVSIKEKDEPGPKIKKVKKSTKKKS